MKSLIVGLIGLSILCLGCGKSGTVVIPPPAGNGLAENLWLSSAPASPEDPLALRAKDAKSGVVSVIGMVGGDKDVFVANRALFTLVDRSLKDCNRTGDGCTTPWDYCCEDPKDIRSASVAVEIHEGGKLAPKSVRGFHGLDHGKTVIAQGELRRDEHGNLTLIATGLHVLP